MELIKINNVNAVGIDLIPGAIERRDALLAKASTVTQVASLDEQETAMDFARRIKRALNDVEAARKEVKRPVLDLTEKIDTLAKTFVGKLKDELDRILLLVDGWQTKERLRVQKEEAQRQAEVAKLREQEEAARRELIAAEAKLAKPKAGLSDFEQAEAAQQQVFDAASKAAVLTAQTPAAVERTAGMITRPIIQFEITDTAALYAVRPHWFTLEPKRNVIRAEITKETNLPGLRVWEETKIGVRS